MSEVGPGVMWTTVGPAQQPVKCGRSGLNRADYDLLVPNPGRPEVVGDAERASRP
jgi:hypothetical protein